MYTPWATVERQERWQYSEGQAHTSSNYIALFNPPSLPIRGASIT
jgi:hypothetical protein